MNAEQVFLDCINNKAFNIAKLLMEKNIIANINYLPNAEIYPLVSLTYYQGNYEQIKFLLDNGADVNIKTKFKKESALLVAIQMNNVKLVKLYLEHGADPYLKVGVEKQSAFYYARKIIDYFDRFNVKGNKENNEGYKLARQIWVILHKQKSNKHETNNNR